MKNLLLLLSCLLLFVPFGFAQSFPIGTTVPFHFFLTDPATGSTTTADAGASPRCDVFKNTSTTPIAALGAVASSLSGLTTAGGYLFNVVASVGNGFSVGDVVTVDCSTVVAGVSGSVAKDRYRLLAADTTAGYTKVDTQLINNVSSSNVTTINANQGTTQPINFTGTGASALAKTDVIDWNSTAVTAPNTAGTPVVDVGRINNVATTSVTTVSANQGTTQPVNFTGTGATAYVKVDGQMILGAAINTSTAQLGVNLVAWKGTTAATVDTAGYPVVTVKDGTGAGEIDTNAGGVITRAMTAAALADFFDTDSGTTYAASVAGSVVKETVDNAGGSLLTTGAIADAVWDEATAGHATAGTTGKALTDASSAGDPWSTALPGAYVGGSAGQIIGQVLFDAATTVGTINTNVSSALTRLPAALTADGNMKADTLRVNGTAQTAGDIVGSYLSLMQVLPKGVAYPGYPVFIRQAGTATGGVTGATVACTKAVSNGAGWSGFSSTGISNITAIGNGYYSIDLDNTVIGNTTIILCTATGGSGTAENPAFIQTIFGQQ